MMPGNMKKSSILIMILMMTLRFAMAQKGENLVRNGTFEQGNVGFKSDFRFFSDEAFGGLLAIGSYRITNNFPDQENRFHYPISQSCYDSLGKYDSLGYKGSYTLAPRIYNRLDTYADSLERVASKPVNWDSLDRMSPVPFYRPPHNLHIQTAVNPEGQYTGNFLTVNVNKDASGYQRLWYDSITIKPNTTYYFSCIVANVWNKTYVIIEKDSVLSRTDPQTVLCHCWHCQASKYISPILLVNSKKVSNPLFNVQYSKEWRILSGKFTSGPNQTRIEISIQNWQWPNLVAVDNIVFKEIQPGEKEFAKKEQRFTKKRDKDSAVAYKKEPVKKEESVVETPPVKDEEVIAVITPSVKKEEAEIEIPPVKEEEPVVEIPPVKEEEPVVEIPPKMEPSVVVQPKEKATIIVPPKQIHPVEVQPKPKLAEVVPPKPKPPVVIQPKKKPSVVVPPKPVKKDTAAQIVPASADFKKDISIEDIKVDQKLQLSHIYFERAKYNLLTTSFPELNDLVTFMKKYSTVRIKLEGHTDNQGNPLRNLELSENRAKEVKKYLVEQGIDYNRIEWIGYGGQKPIYSNSNADEYLRQKNRRVEILIISK
jgi:outer membrane protein OmpA-like peptidoglycan-associated protein